MKHIYGALELILPILFWILVMLAFDTPGITLITLSCALLHELGHIACMALVTKRKLTLPRAVLSGLRLRSDRILSYKEELAVAAAGPLLNLLLFTFFFLFSTRGVGNSFLFATINLLTAISNLIPARGYDGYRIIRCLLSLYWGDTVSEGVCEGISLFCSAFTVFLSLAFILMLDAGYWIFVVFFFNLCAEISKKQGRNNLENS